MPGNSAEIGVAEGYFSADILSWEISFPRHYLVDRWKCVPGAKGDSGNPQVWHDKNFKAARERVAQYGDRAMFLRGDSADVSMCVPARSLALVYVDGDHTFEGVATDILIWTPKLVSGGVIAFHDYLAPQYGVKRAVDKFAYVNDLPLYLIPEDKPEDAGAWIRI